MILILRDETTRPVWRAASRLRLYRATGAFNAR